jgi:glycosyltransferase involved in cell wall biosynthesis
MVDLGGAWGGQENYSASIMHYLRNKGWKVTSLSGQDRHSQYASAFFPVSISYMRFLKTVRLVNELQKSHDVVHFNGIRAIYLSLFCKKTKPFIGTKHSRNLTALHVDAKAVLAKLIGCFAFQKLDWLICVSPKVREELRGAVRHRSTIIMNGVAEIDCGHTIASETMPTLCYVGGFFAFKGVLRLIEAVRILKLRNCTFKVLMAGVGPLENEVKRYVQEHGLEGIVSFLGFVEELNEVYAQSHIFVLPSIYEGLPLSLLEASSAGCALVGHDVPGVADVIVDGCNGLLAPISADGLADKLHALIVDRGFLEGIRQRSRKAYENKWRVDRMLDETIDIYRRFM